MEEPDWEKLLKDGLTSENIKQAMKDFQFNVVREDNSGQKEEVLRMAHLHGNDRLFAYRDNFTNKRPCIEKPSVVECSEFDYKTRGKIDVEISDIGLNACRIEGGMMRRTKRRWNSKL